MPHDDILESPRQRILTDSPEDCYHSPARYNPLHLPESMGIPFEMRVSAYWKHSPDSCVSPRCDVSTKCVDESKQRKSGDPAPSVYEMLRRHVNCKLVVCFCSCVFVYWAARRWTAVYNTN